MIKSIKNKMLIGLIMSVIAALGVWINPYTITKKTIIEQYEIDKFNDSTSIAKLSIELKAFESKIFSIQQDLDICNGNKTSRETVIYQLTQDRNSAQMEAKKLQKEIDGLEKNGFIQYYIFDRRGLFEKGCFRKVLEKPDPNSICK